MTRTNSTGCGILGIKSIASYVPETHVDNLEQAARFGADQDFVKNKIGVLELPRLGSQETVVSSCIAALDAMRDVQSLDIDDIDCVVVCTQNPDKAGLPHNSALIHGALGLSRDCACFDVGLGCSGYVYSLSVIQSFMAAHGLKKGLLFTCDPYSRILDDTDKNTCLLFGDAATVTLIDSDPVYTLSHARFCTNGSSSKAIQSNDGLLEMNGRAVFNFALQEIPGQISGLLGDLEMTPDDIDLFLLHQGSRFMCENVVKRAGLPADRAPIEISKTGNTVSSSIPLLLEGELAKAPRRILMAGFGVGLSWATALYSRVE